jgi:hypothetical protein
MLNLCRQGKGLQINRAYPSKIVLMFSAMWHRYLKGPAEQGVIGEYRDM